MQLTAGPQNMQPYPVTIAIPMHTSKGATQHDPKFTKYQHTRSFSCTTNSSSHPNTSISPTKPLRRSQQIADLGILTAKPLTNNASAHNTCSQVQHHTITQEAILACMRTCSYITSRSLTPANAARCLFPIKILNAVLDINTGKLLEMRHLLVNPEYKELWGKSYTTELGCLA
jgi:hypothetical protein